MATQYGHIECIVHRDNTLMLELEHWRGGKTTIQTLPVVNGVAITLVTTEEEDILLLHRNNNALFITLKSSALYNANITCGECLHLSSCH